jgi:hypothetical protein
MGAAEDFLFSTEPRLSLVPSASPVRCVERFFSREFKRQKGETDCYFLYNVRGVNAEIYAFTSPDVIRASRK